MIGNKIADKITSVSKKSSNQLPNDETELDVERVTSKKRYISPEERQQSIDELRLALKRMCKLKLTLKDKIHIPRRKTTNY